MINELEQCNWCNERRVEADMLFNVFLELYFCDQNCLDHYDEMIVDEREA